VNFVTNVMNYHRWNVLITGFILLSIIFHATIYWQFEIFRRSQRLQSTSLVHSGIAKNSFNPNRIHVKLNVNLTTSHILIIMDNDIRVPWLATRSQSSTSSVTLTLADGYHHMQLRLVSSSWPSIHYYEEIDLTTGYDTLLVTVLDQQHRFVPNVSVHITLVKYSHITREHRTNAAGQVTFNYLARRIHLSIDAVCWHTKQYAFVEINTTFNRRINLTLKKMNTADDDEYQSNDDRGYYAVWKKVFLNHRNTIISGFVFSFCSFVAMYSIRIVVIIIKHWSDERKTTVPLWIVKINKTTERKHTRWLENDVSIFVMNEQTHGLSW
jgi:hypothetical protein